MQISTLSCCFVAGNDTKIDLSPGRAGNKMLGILLCNFHGAHRISVICEKTILINMTREITNIVEEIEFNIVLCICEMCNISKINCELYIVSYSLMSLTF